MLSFEVSVIDIILGIAVIVLLLLFITHKTGQMAADSFHTEDHERPSEKPETICQTVNEEPSIVQSSVGFQKCVHHFGYLKNLPKNASVPDECFGCQK